jgi:cobalamin biosynthesis protein CobT
LEVRQSAARQQQRNEAYQTEHAAMVQGTVRALSTLIDTVFSSYFKHLPEPSRAGRIRPEQAYRLPVLDDARVFLKDGEETEPEICVDLLLDASQSRMHSQEVLSTEATIIAKSLARVHIRTRQCPWKTIGFI